MPHSYCDHILDLLSSWRTVRARKMFGGYGIYHNDVMFGLVDDDVLYFKVNNTTRTAYESAGATPFTYQGKTKTIALSYWNIPAEILDDAELLNQWAETAYKVARENKVVKKPTRKKATKQPQF